MTRSTTAPRTAPTRVSLVVLACAAVLAPGSAGAGIIVNAVGVGQATGDVWGHLTNPPSRPPSPPTHTLTVAGFLPNVTLGPSLSLCDPQTFVAITAISPTPFTYRYDQDGRAFGGDSIGAGGADLAQYVKPVSPSSRATVQVTEMLDPSELHFGGLMSLSDSGAAARLRLIDGADPAHPNVIYEDLFLNPGRTRLDRMIDINIPVPSGGAGTLFLQLDTYAASTPAPATLSLMGTIALVTPRRRR